MRTLLISQHVRPSAQAVPLAAASIKAALPDNLRRTTTLVDLFSGYDVTATASKLLQAKPKVIGLSLYLWNRVELLTLARALRRLQPDIVLLAGGPEASADSQRVLDDGQLDGVICGEGEEIFTRTLEKLNNGEPLETEPGLLTIDDPGTIPLQTVTCQQLEQLPSPWLTKELELAPGCGVLWEVARGCQFNCAFCYDAKGHQGVRPLPFSRLRQELELFAQNQVGQIWVLDSSFNAPTERGKQLLQLLLEIAPEIHYHIEAKIEYLDEETIDLLAQLSCSVQIGLQSALPQVLKPLHRHLDRDKMARQLEQLSYAGVTFGLDLIYGLPGDNHQGFTASIDYALEQQPNQVDIFPLSILPGTEIYANQERFQIFGEQQPPYLQTENHSYSSADFAASQELAASADIFYNRGRAVGFFRQLMTTLQEKPSRFLTDFYLWLNGTKQIPREKILDAGHWEPAQIRPLQLEFCRFIFTSANKNKLLPLVEDLINFNYCCAETLLAGECVPQKLSRVQRKNPNQRFILNPQVQLYRFSYLLEELGEIADFRLDKVVKQLHRQAGYGIFLQQGGELIMEMLDDQFAAMLTKADSAEGQTLRQLMDMLDRHSGKELLDFALQQGLLVTVP